MLRVYTFKGCCDARWLTGLWSTQAKMEAIMPRAARHWSRDSSVVNDPHREPVGTAFYVGLPSAWVSVDGDLILFPIL